MWRQAWHERWVGEAQSRVVMRCRRRRRPNPRRLRQYAWLLLLLLLLLRRLLLLLLLLSSEGVSLRLHSGALHREVAPWGGRRHFIRQRGGQGWTAAQTDLGPRGTDLGPVAFVPPPF